MRNGANPLALGRAVAGAIAVVYHQYPCSWWTGRDLHEQYQQRTLQLYKMAALSGQEAWLVRADRARARRPRAAMRNLRAVVFG